jgi:hypothetical protein
VKAVYTFIIIWSGLTVKFDAVGLERLDCVGQLWEVCSIGFAGELGNIGGDDDYFGHVVCVVLAAVVLCDGEKSWKTAALIP